MNIFKKLTISLSIALILSNNVYAALSLDDQAEAFFRTQTGSHLHSLYPHLKPVAAVKKAIDHVVSNYRTEIEEQSTNSGVCVFDYNKKQEEIDRLFNQVNPLLGKEIEFGDSYAIFYTGFSSAIAAYNSYLKSLIEIAGMQDLSGVHPLHYKTDEQSQVKDIDQFLSHYYSGYCDYIDQLNQNGGNFTPIDWERTTGTGKAPDLSDYARTHLKCVNLSLFGNLSLSHPFECTFFYYLTSGNVGQFNDMLTTKLLKSAGIIVENATQQEIDNKLAPYKQLFSEKMAQGGGGLLQIMMKNAYVDQNGFASWAKGIPYFVSRNTGEFAVRDHDNDKAVPVLSKETKNLEMPSLLDMVKLYKENPDKFQHVYGIGEQGDMDRVQARLFINPELFTNSEVVHINQTTRNAVDPADEADYNKKLHTQLLNDLTDAVSKDQLNEEFSNRYSFGKMVNYALGKTGISDLIDIVFKTTKKAYTEAVEAVKKATTTVAATDKEVALHVSIMESIEKSFDTLKQIGKNTTLKVINVFRKAFD